MLPLTEFYLLSFHLRFDPDKWNSPSQNTSTSYYTRLNTKQDATFCCSYFWTAEPQLCLRWAERGDLWAALGTDVSTQLPVISQHPANSPCHSPSEQGWCRPALATLQLFTKLTFTNTYILNLLSVPHYKESLQRRIWSIHCFDVLLGLLHSLWNNFGWSGRWMSMLLSVNHKSTLDKKYQTERACFLLWQYYQRLAAWAQTELQQQKLYLYIFQNYVLAT